MPQLPLAIFLDEIRTIGLPDGVGGLAALSDHARRIPVALRRLAILGHFDDGRGGDVEQKLAHAAVGFHNLFIGHAGQIDALLNRIALGGFQPVAVMAYDIGLPDGVVADVAALVLTKGCGRLIGRFLHPDLFHLRLMLTIAMIQHMAAHQILHRLDIQRTLGVGRYSGNILVGIGLRACTDGKRHGHCNHCAQEHSHLFHARQFPFTSNLLPCIANQYIACQTIMVVEGQ